MQLKVRESTGGSNNKHPRSDQWIFVLAGTATAIVKGRKRRLRPGALLLIEAGETHELINQGKHQFRAVTFYAPPAY
jgi:mannose-6-phosphate isomerase-like protein (cupin superfamily)